ncbi:type II toxin-antitoxin system RelE/ParE family toxin [Rhizobium laguerreae]|uniref:Type II toxin-antitoxin system RelE/ParE family toxin n=1 Tax=Rhizobium laguerreae TaxID=1076926 RepID=A0A7Y2W6W1_9HYPH|nr:type II toxin-antitoxin system RelE/ParE family toxin [Rhizobium laguerreae]
MKDLEFEDWAAEYNVTDAMLCDAAKEIEAGLVDARLGGFLLKKRVAAPGRGKRGSYRTIVGHRQGDRLIFVHGFAKNETDNITKKEKEALRKLCDVYMLADDKKLVR